MAFSVLEFWDIEVDLRGKHPPPPGVYRVNDENWYLDNSHVIITFMSRFLYILYVAIDVILFITLAALSLSTLLVSL